MSWKEGAASVGLRASRKEVAHQLHDCDGNDQDDDCRHHHRMVEALIAVGDGQIADAAGADRPGNR